MSCSSLWKDFPEIWRFEECPELFDYAKSGEIVFFNRDQSNILWSLLISSKEKNLMKIGSERFDDVEKYEVTFDNHDSAGTLFDRFSKRAGALDFVILFFDANSSCALKFNLLRKFRNEIFLISDETTIAIDVVSKIVLFSFEDRFFIAKQR